MANFLGIKIEEWMPMPWQMGPPLPKSMGIYWPWYKAPVLPEVIYACPYCAAEFGTEAELIGHIVTAHPAQPPQVIYMCPYCGAKFSTMSELQAHITAVHPPAPPPVVYTCPYCGAQFATQADLNYHIEIVHPAAPPPVVYTCPHCGAQFATQAELAYHIETVHPPAPPPVAEFKITDLSASPTTVEVGKAVTISFRVTNIGSAEGTYSILCRTIDDEGTVVASKTFSRKIGAGTTVVESTTFTPAYASTYYTYVDNYWVTFVASEAPPAPPATGMIILYGTGWDVKGTDWHWYADWYYPEGWRPNMDDYYGRRGPNDPCTPPKPIQLNNLRVNMLCGSYEYGWGESPGKFGPFVVEDGGIYTLNIKTGQLSER